MPARQITLLGGGKLMPQRISQTFLRLSAPLTRYPAQKFSRTYQHVEDQCAAYVRYCFQDPMDAAIFRSRFEPKSEPFRLAG